MSATDQPDPSAARPGELFIGAATVATTAEEVRQVWRQAHAAGQPQWYLDLVAGIGRTKPGARTADTMAGAA
ncbi:hypothetical protein CFP65_3273 [Kitasatospora sp. MMS16-BH015]|uniref:hypothetical protein n=1 Tax=Kitasatospora sp. MMS16-BH015 TaxID=2018025 RepID=UPI000CA200E2|nr:hypothetical protein [Kitasatospora sp. MMS16-BH015]AUG78074.1 hypothetical protein CFP65_3273 [Kitasatospora sp. MMS16-BH015]